MFKELNFHSLTLSAVAISSDGKVLVAGTTTGAFVTHLNIPIIPIHNYLFHKVSVVRFTLNRPFCSFKLAFNYWFFVILLNHSITNGLGAILLFKYPLRYEYLPPNASPDRSFKFNSCSVKVDAFQSYPLVFIHLLQWKAKRLTRYCNKQRKRVLIFPLLACYYLHCFVCPGKKKKIYIVHNLVCQRSGRSTRFTAIRSTLSGRQK